MNIVACEVARGVWGEEDAAHKDTPCGERVCVFSAMEMGENQLPFGSF